jgi:pimeloyl-ACP methyl ester carboxylesterase
LDIFAASFGSPTRTIAWGHSLGGIITAGLIQRFPGRFDGALPMCGVLSGGVATWNQALDSAFAFKTLLAFGSPLQVTNITDPASNFALAEGILASAAATPQGRARLALSFALGDAPGWFLTGSAEPASTDFADQFANQFAWAKFVDFPFIFALRSDLELRAGGNPSWNTNVNYKVQLSQSVDRVEVEALYAAAGLDLNADLETLNNAARISANPLSVKYLEHNIIFDGKIHIPVLSMHTSGDGLVSNQNESAYADVVDETGKAALLRRTFVHRAGHCAFSPAETLTALSNLIHRLDTGVWPDLDSATLNAEAAAFGPTLNVAVRQDNVLISVPPSFFDFSPAPFLRPFDVFDARSCARTQGEASGCNDVF